MKCLKLYSLCSIFLSTSFLAVKAQIPQDSLVAWYPFNGNPKDASGNGYNGKVNGATLTYDRFGIPNSAYSFSNSTDNIIIASLNENNVLKYSISGWFLKNSSSINKEGTIFCGSDPCNAPGGLRFCIGQNNQANFGVEYQSCSSKWQYSNGKNYADDTWHSFVAIFDGIVGLVKANQLKVYVDNVLVSADSISQGNLSNVLAPINNQGLPTILGNVGSGNSLFTTNDVFQGNIDDIRVYNRALTLNEIASLYNENICLEAISVTDTLRVSTVTGFNSIPENFGTMKVYPNPSNSNITLDAGNTTGNYNVRITNSLGSTVYTATITQQKTVVNMSSLGVMGVYYLVIQDISNNVLDSRKLILE